MLAALLVGWAALCGLRYWLKVQASNDCLWYLTHAPARSAVADTAMQCYIKANEARDATIMWGLGIPFLLMVAFWLMVWFLRSEASKAPADGGGE